MACDSKPRDAILDPLREQIMAIVNRNIVFSWSCTSIVKWSNITNGSWLCLMSQWLIEFLRNLSLRSERVFHSNCLLEMHKGVQPTWHFLISSPQTRSSSRCFVLQAHAIYHHCYLHSFLHGIHYWAYNQPNMN